MLMVKDPWWLYAYWEIQPGIERAARKQLTPPEIAGLRSILRVHDVTDRDFPTQPAHQAFDIPLSGLATSWFIHPHAPHREFIVDIGLLTAGGRFLLLARSNRVRTPRASPSEVIDPAWAVSDEAWRQLGAMVGVGASGLFSGGRASLSRLGQAQPALAQGFWCRVNADLIIHGVTEPKATVAIQGQPVAVRKDGSFSLRLALPEGERAIAIDVTSPDGQQVHTITTAASCAISGAFHVGASHA